MKKLLLFILCLALATPACALAERDIAQDMKDAGEKVGGLLSQFGQNMKDWGAQVERWSADVEDYIANDETLRGYVEKGWQAFADIKDYFESGALKDDVKVSYEQVMAGVLGVDAADLKARADAAGQPLNEYWPTYLQSVQGAVEAALASGDEAQLAALGKYGMLAVPYLAAAAVDGKSQQALNELKQRLNLADEEAVKQWIEDNKPMLNDLKKLMRP